MSVNHKSKILLVLPSLNVGGMERAMSILANSFVNRGFSVAFFLYKKAEHFYPLDDAISFYEPNYKTNNKLAVIKNILRYRKVCKEWMPDAILSYGQNCNILTMIANFGTGFRLFISDRGNPIEYSKKISHRIIRYFFSKYLAGIIQQSEKAKDIVLKELRCSNVTVIGNPIPQIEYDIVHKTKRENIVLSVGRFISTKNFDVLIKWFSELETTWKLVILGGDFQYNQCLQLVEELNCKDRIILPGKVSNVQDYMLRSKVFAFTSTSEGFPNVIGEALSAGLPVVAFDCMAGPAEMIINDYNGFLIENFDKDNFCEKLMRLINNDVLLRQMSENAFLSVKKFAAEKISEETLAFLVQNKQH